MQKEIKLPIIKVVKALLVFAARGDVRYYLNGVHVRREGDGVLLTSSPTLALRVTGGGFPLLGDSCSRSTGFLLHRAA